MLEPGEQSHATKGLLRLTMACNERCPFCNVPMEDYPSLTPPEEAALAEVDSFAASGARTLTISGGEPTLLRARLLRVVERARQLGLPHIELQTNAILIDPPYARDLARAGLTSAFVSLLSHRAAEHDLLAGLEGAHGRCLRGLDALAEAGLRLTLNPVLARPTQELLPDYVDFTAARLPAVRLLSLSAIQPHGRARHHRDLWPDYAVLARIIPQALDRAEAQAIEVVNPYCGLPLCVGWQQRWNRSVEAQETEEAPSTPRGLNNEGNKRHGAPCRSCAWRSRCGGAWHEHWDLRGGEGLEAPQRSTAPWSVRPPEPGLQELIDARHGPPPPAGPRRLPLRWWWCRDLSPGQLGQLYTLGVTDLAVELHLDELSSLTPTLRELRRLGRLNALRPPQRQIQLWLGWRGPRERLALGLELGRALGAVGFSHLDRGRVG